MARPPDARSVVPMNQQTPVNSHVRTLKERRAQLEVRVARLSVAIRDSHGRQPWLGRELDASSSQLAQARAELTRLRADRSPQVAGRR